MNPHLYEQLIYNKWDENTHREKTASLVNGFGETSQLHSKESN